MRECRCAFQVLCATLRTLALCCCDAVHSQVQAHVDSVEDQEHLRAAVVAGGLVAFVRSGAVLPRDSGDSDLVGTP